MTQENEDVTMNQDVFRTRVWWVAFVVVLVGLGALVVLKAASTFLLAFAGILFGVLLHGLARVVHQATTLPKSACLLGVLTLLVALCGLMGYLLGPRLAAEGNELVQQLPRVHQQIRAWLGEYQWGQELLANLSNLKREVASSREVWTQISHTFGLTFTTLGYVVVVLFLGIYLAWQPDLYVKGITYLVPTDHRDSAGKLFERLSVTLRRWMLGKIASMSLVGVLTIIGLLVLGMPLPFTLGILAALLAFIPNFGPVLAIIPAMLFALPQGLNQVGWVVGLYVAVQTFESYVITPIIQREMTRVPPAAILFAQVLLTVLFGALGLLLAVPLTAIGFVVIDELYLKPREENEAEQSSSVPGNAK